MTVTHQNDNFNDPDDDGEDRAGDRSRFAWFTEAFVLKNIFRLMIVAVLVFLAYDVRTIYEEANAPLPGRTAQNDPVVMVPPTPRDQVRPYLPLNNPAPRKGNGPVLPGYTRPPRQEEVGARMTFRRGPNGALSAVGRITPGISKDFAAFVMAQAGEIKTLYLHSPGGSVQDALDMSKLIRDQGIATMVPDDGYCASSCPIVFAGGKTRTTGRRAWIGVHRIFAVKPPPGDVHAGIAHGQEVSARVQDHFFDMGVDLRVWIQAMKTPSEQLYVFTPQELKEYKLATEVVGEPAGAKSGKPVRKPPSSKRM